MFDPYWKKRALELLLECVPFPRIRRLALWQKKARMSKRTCTVLVVPLVEPIILREEFPRPTSEAIAQNMSIHILYLIYLDVLLLWASLVSMGKAKTTNLALYVKLEHI